MAARPVIRPWRRLGLVALVLAALYGTAIGIGHLTPKLGLDLRGGTSVILTPVKTSAATTGALNQAVDIIRQRVDGLGVSDASVVRQGTNVIISVPGKGRSSVLNLVGQTAALDFRIVYTEGAGVNSPAHPAKVVPAPSGSSTAHPAASSSARAATSPSSSPSSSPSATHSDALSAALTTGRPAVTAGSPSPPPAPANVTVPAAGATSAPPRGPTPPAKVLAAYAALQCTPQNIRPRNFVDSPGSWIAACDRTGSAKYLLEPASLRGTAVSSASATLQTGPNNVVTSNWIVQLSFKSSQQATVYRITSSLAGKNIPLAIVLDGVVESAPVIDSAFGYSGAEIQGSSAAPFTQTEANDLANVLKYGALPLAFNPSQVQSISASLGRSSLNAGLFAGGLGLLLVLLYCFVYYRALGIVTIASLLVSGLNVYIIVSLLGQAIGYTLTLAGVAGLIVSVGITADSFVVFYERLKDEVREGRSVRSSVPRAWKRARRTILSADTVSFLAAVILYLVSIGDVRGFAFTLGVSTLLDIFTVFLFTLPVVSLLVKRKLFSTSRASGLAAGRVSAAGRQRALVPGGAAKEA